MNENMYYPRREDDEVTIDIKNLLDHILKKWKLILAVTVICVVIGGIIAAFKSGGSNNTAGGGDKVAATAQGLTEAQKNEAEKYCEQLKAYDRAIRDQKRLNDESYFMNLAPSTAVGSNIWYMIETELGNVTTIYTDMLSDEDYRKISEILGTENERKYLKDAVTVWSEETTDTYDMDITRTDQMSGDIKNEYKLLLKLTVTAPDRESCDKIAEIAEAAVKRETDNLAGYGAVIKCTLINKRTFDTDVEERIVAANQLKINALGTLETNRGNFYNNVISRFDENEKAYIDALYSANTEEIGETINESKLSWKSLLKYMIACVVAGVIAVVGAMTVMYFFDGKIHVVGEINGMGAPVLQTFTAGDSDSFSVLIEELKKRTESETKKIYIATDKSSSIAVEYAKRIYNEIDEKTCYTGGIVLDGGDMKQLMGSDSVLILPVIGSTKRSSMIMFIDICARNRICIMGSAPIK